MNIHGSTIFEKMDKKLLSPIAFLSAAAFFAGSLGAQTTYSDQQTFEDLLLTSYSEDFSDYDSDDNDSNQVSRTFDGEGTALFSFDATTASQDGEVSPAPAPEAAPVDDVPIWFVSGDGYSGTALSVIDDARLRFTGFSPDVDSFGGQFFLTDPSDTAGGDDLVGGSLDIIVTFSDNTEETYTMTSPEPGNAVEFFGVIAEQGTAITQVDIRSTTAGALPTAGFVTVGAAIPEPATVVFWSGLGVFALVVAWRRRKQAA